MLKNRCHYELARAILKPGLKLALLAAFGLALAMGPQFNASRAQEAPATASDEAAAQQDSPAPPDPEGLTSGFGGLPEDLEAGGAAETDEAGPLGKASAPAEVKEVPTLDDLNLERLPVPRNAQQGNQGQGQGQNAPQQAKSMSEAEIRRRAFEAAVNGLLPMNPEEIRRLLRRFDETREASEKPIDTPPKPEVKVANVSLDPGVDPPTILLAKGNVTSLTILDATGQPWPIRDVSWAGEFDVITPEANGHVIRITPMGGHALGNLSLRLKELKTPVTFSLRTQEEVVQYRFDARIGEMGPNAESPIIESGISAVAGDAVLNAVLDGVPPSGARRLEVSGTDGRTTAYAVSGVTYVRTPLTLLSPGWNSSVRSADGMKVYSLSGSPVLLLSDRGQIVRARVGRPGDNASQYSEGSSP